MQAIFLFQMQRNGKPCSLLRSNLVSYQLNKLCVSGSCRVSILTTHWSSSRHSHLRHRFLHSIHQNSLKAHQTHTQVFIVLYMLSSRHEHKMMQNCHCVCVSVGPSALVLRPSQSCDPSSAPSPVESRIKQDKSTFEEQERQRVAQEARAQKQQKKKVGKFWVQNCFGKL